ncbi:MAG: GNAT family N-acetyltransferase [Pedobacter sp.]|nr:GNAT family N-acetyltransferase [Pedobacter sp.]
MKGEAENFIILTDRDLTTKYISQVSAAADSHRNELGFLPKSVYSEFCRRDCLHVIVEIEDGISAYAGHLIFDHRYPKVSIIQMFTEPKYRQHGLAKKLISNLKTLLTEKSFTSIYARVAEDLIPANKFWQGQGFYIQRMERGGATRNRKILVRCHELESPQLFPTSGISSDNPLGLKPSDATESLFLVDLNVLFDSAGPRRLRNKVVFNLFQAEKIGLCKIAISDEIRDELSRHTPVGKSDPMLEYTKVFPTLPLLDTESNKSRINELSRIVFPHKEVLSENDKSDIRHLATAIQYNLTGFITSDTAILEASSAIREGFNIDVLSPEIFTIEQNSISEDSSFESASCGEIRLSSVSHLDTQKIHNLLSELGISTADIISGWAPVTSATAARAVWVGEELIGYSSWSSDASGLTARAALNEAHPESLSAGRILLTYLMETLPKIGPVKITLSLAHHQSLLREHAISQGFRGTSNQKSLTKLFVGTLVTDSSWKDFRKSLIDKEGLKLPERCPSFTDQSNQIEVLTPSGERTFPSFDEIESLLSPVLFCLPDRPSVITPIQRQYAEELLGHSPQASLLPLRSASLFKEKHYLSAKKNLKHFKKGTLILFYESAKNGGSMSIIAVARCRHCYLKSQDNIEKSDLERSALTKESIKNIGKSDMKAVVSFDNIHIFKKSVPLDFLKKIGCGKETDLISTKAISKTQLLAILTEASS